MLELKSIDAIEEAIKEGAALLYVSAPNCSVCEALKPKVEALFAQRFPKVRLYEANVAKIPQIGARLRIFSAPAILIFFDGQEFAREGRNVSLELLAERMEKIYGLYFG